MKALLRTVLVLALIAAPTIAMAQTGIRNTKHDLSSSSSGGLVINQAGNNQICIYCHTPHQAQSTAMLWNHAASANTSWTWGTDLDGNALTATATGTLLPGTLRSASKRCLACHDGTVALGNVSNAGSGVTGTILGLAGIAGYTSSAGNLTDPSKLIGTSGGNLGGNHPVSIPYAGQSGYNGISSSVPASWLGGAVGGYYSATTAGCVSPSGVCTAATGDGRIGANINLIPNTAGTTTNVGVECTSCHEPHNKYGYQWFTVADVTNASGLCRSCHNK